jgi:hypothetical protein
MRLKNVASFSVLGVFVVTLSLGCGEGTDVKVAEAPAVKPGPVVPVPKTIKEGGGPSSSGNMKRNPGADPLSKD